MHPRHDSPETQRPSGSSPVGQRGLTATCPLCGQSARQRLRLPHTGVWECLSPSCRLQFADPQLDASVLDEAYRTLYHPADTNGNPAIQGTPSEVILQILGGIAQRMGGVAGARLLDYGCGTGEFGRIAQEQSLAVVGIEQDPQARQQIAKRSLFPVYADIDELARNENAPFDLIILWQVIEHLRQPWNDLARLRRLLALRGRLIAATPNAEGLRARWLRSRWENYTHPTHLYYFGLRSLRNVFERAGFSESEEWRVKVAYPNHKWPRRGVHSVLAALRVDGDLILAARNGGDAVSGKAAARSDEPSAFRSGGAPKGPNSSRSPR